MECDSLNKGEKCPFEDTISINGIHRIQYGLDTYGPNLFDVVKTFGRDFFYLRNHRDRARKGKKLNLMPIGVWSLIQNKMPLLYGDLEHVYTIIDERKIKKDEQ